MYDLRRFFPDQYAAARAALCGLGLVAFSLTAAAQSVTVYNPAYQQFRSQVAGDSAMLFYGSGGSLLPRAGSAQMSATSSGAILQRVASLNTARGPVAFTVAQRFSPAALAKAVAVGVTGGAVGVGLSVAAYVATPYIADWLADAGVGIDPATSEPRQQSTGNIVCSMATPGGVPRPGYIWHANTGNAVGQWCGEGLEGYPNFVSAQGSIVSVGPPSLGSVLTSEQIEQKLADAQRATDALFGVMLEHVESIGAPPVPDAADKPVVSSPGSSPVQRSTQTKTLPDGTVETTVRDCKTSGKLVPTATSTVKIVEECTVTQTSTPPAGSPTTTTTETSTEDPAVTDPQTTGEEAGFCETLVGKLLCADLDTPEAEPIDKTTKTITYATENHFGGGACPADQVMTTHNGQSLKVWDWATSCQKINQFFRPLFLTLCAFTALMILAPAVKEA